MALDRFVYWNEKKPTKEQLEKILKNFLGEGGTVEWKDDRWYCSLPGTPTHPLQGVAGFSQRGCAPPRDDERWFEVFWHEGKKGDDIKPSIDVITRQQDEYTNALARCFQELCASIWEASLER